MAPQRRGQGVSELIRYVAFEDIERMHALGWRYVSVASFYSVFMRWEGEGEPA
jgi:hypothetical protein